MFQKGKKMLTTNKPEKVKKIPPLVSSHLPQMKMWTVWILEVGGDVSLCPPPVGGWQEPL